MESTTYLKNLRISPKKLRFFLPAIKVMSPAQSAEYLFYVNKKPANIFYKAIKSALNNAKNALKVDPDLLQFKLLTVEEGQKLKRYKAGGRGTAKPIKRRLSHIKIILKAVEHKPEPETEVKKIEAAAKSEVQSSKINPPAGGRSSKPKVKK